MVKITKIAESAEPDFKSAKWASFIPGVENEGVSLPVEYTVKGEFIMPMDVGGTIFLNRSERNGVKAPGHFMSSVITNIRESNGVKVVTTRNSVYLVQKEPS